MKKKKNPYSEYILNVTPAGYDTQLRTIRITKFTIMTGFSSQHINISIYPSSMSLPQCVRYSSGIYLNRIQSESNESNKSTTNQKSFFSRVTIDTLLPVYHLGPKNGKRSRELVNFYYWRT